MANSGVKGFVLDDSGQALEGVLVGVYDIDGCFGERLLPDSSPPLNLTVAGLAQSKADGSFSISYAPGKYSLQVRVFTQNKRLLSSSPIVSGVTQNVLTLADPIIVKAAGMAGWIVRDGAFPSPISGSNVRFLVDNEECWDEVITAVDHASISIHWMLFYLDIGKTIFDFTSDPADLRVTGRRLEAALDAAGERGIQVRLVCNQLTAGDIPLPYPVTSAALVQDWFAQSARPNIVVRRMQTPAYIPIHTKFVVIDNREAFVLGSPFIQDYYDSSRHLIDDPRHGDFAEVLCDSHGIKQPTHDVNLHVTGSALGPLNDTFALHWNAAKPQGAPDLPPIPVPAAVASNGAVQVTRSLTGNARFSSFPRGETTILDAYLRAIGNASDFIYLENQYFTCEEIADALVIAVKANPKLDVIFLTNNAVDIPGYEIWQPATIQRVRDGLTAEERARIGFFTLWSHETAAAAGQPTRICRNYVHSKVAIVDDLWATVGSANLDGDSLLFSQNAVRGAYWLVGGLLGMRQDGVLTENRESETNLVIYNGIEGQPASTFPADLRRRLWAEHLGFLASGKPDPTDATLATKPAAGWLDLWQTRANAKLVGLKAAAPTVHPARVLAYPVPAEERLKDAKIYLETLGVDLSKVKQVPHYRRFSWDKGTWEDGP
jgi:phosphatidylserine/phosphatidylglycerophosphate/cardiolipin synthase-like enzyme